MLEQRLAIPWATQAFVLVLRRVGLPLLGLVFFLAWTVVYIALWVIHPEQAFTGLPVEPRFSDFFYYAVCTAVISPPGDIFADLARRPERDDDRDALGVRAAHGLPRELRRLAAAADAPPPEE